MKTRQLDQRGIGHILVLILIIVILGAIGFTGWRVMQSHKKSNTSSTKTPTAQNTASQKQNQASSAADVIQQVRSALSSQFTVSSNDMTKLAVGSINISSSSLSPIWKPAGSDFYLSPDNGSGLQVAYAENSQLSQAESQSKQIADTITAALTSSGLTKASGGFSTSDYLQQYYANSSVVCSVEDVSAAPNPVAVSCADQSTYAPAVTKLQPLYDAYVKSGSVSQSENIAFAGSPKITNSKTPGYQTASVEITGGSEGFEGLFYAKDGQWHYFTSSQMMLNCSQFNTQDLRLAFAGTQCYDSSTQQNSTVQ